MLTIRVTKLEAFRKYMYEDENSYNTFENLLLTIKDERGSGDKADYGSAFHKIIEYPDMVSQHGCLVNGIQFSYAQALPAVEYANAHPLMQKEVPISKVYQTKHFEILVTGTCDGIEGISVRDTKTKYSTVDMQEYMRSYQWRTYLDILGLDTFWYDVFQVRGLDTLADAHKANIEALEPMLCCRYPDMSADVQSLLDEFSQFVIDYDLLQYLEIKDKPQNNSEMGKTIQPLDEAIEEKDDKLLVVFTPEAIDTTTYKIPNKEESLKIIADKKQFATDLKIVDKKDPNYKLAKSEKGILKKSRIAFVKSTKEHVTDPLTSMLKDAKSDISAIENGFDEVEEILEGKIKEVDEAEQKEAERKEKEAEALLAEAKAQLQSVTDKLEEKQVRLRMREIDINFKDKYIINNELEQYEINGHTFAITALCDMEDDEWDKLMVALETPLVGAVNKPQVGDITPVGRVISITPSPKEEEPPADLFDIDAEIEASNLKFQKGFENSIMAGSPGEETTEVYLSDVQGEEEHQPTIEDTEADDKAWLLSKIADQDEMFNTKTVVLTFNPDRPFKDQAILKSTLRIFPKEYEKEATSGVYASQIIDTDTSMFGEELSYIVFKNK